MAVIRNFRLPEGIGVSADYIETFGVIQSTSPGAGAIVSRGGVGVGNSISIAGRLQLFNGSYYTAFVSSATANTFYTLPPSTPATGSSILQSNSSGVMSWVAMSATGSASGFTNLNSLTSGIQYFSTGTSGSGFNISSSGSTHTFNIPIAGSGSTGLISTQAQTIAGQKTFSSAIIGDLSGTATTAGFATTASYSHQAGYAITSGSASIATTSTYAHTSGYGITAGTSNSWTTPRTLNLSGDLSGSVTWSGSGDTTLSATIAANSVALGTDTTGQYASTVSISGSGITATSAGADDGTAYTIYSSATSNNTASSIVLRDGSGNFTAGTITANLSGTATTAQNINIANANTNSAHPLHFSPSATGSGLATSSNTTLSYNPSTFVLSTSGLAVTSSTASTSSTTGALVVSGGVGIGGSLYVNGDLTINGTTTTINSVTLTVDDKNIEFGSVATPSDLTAEGGGITLKGATDKSINWYTGTGWSSSESLNLSSGNTFKIANTTVLSNSSIGTGITNSSLTALGTIRTGTWSGSLITSLYGGTGYSSYTKGDLLVGAGTTLIKQAVGTQNQILIADLFSGSGLSWATFANPTYGSFYSTTTQPVVGAGATTLITLNSTYESNRVNIIGGSGTSSRIQIQDAGPFSITFSAQINLTSGTQPSTGNFWFRVNGQDIPQSNSISSITGKDYQTLITVNFVYTFATNDYFEIVMSSPDAVFALEATSGLISPPRPSIPSIILSVLPITHIVGASGAGISGILSLNGSTASQQYFLTGTTGTDFNVQTSSGNHTLNIPDASTTARGLITTGSQTLLGSKTFASGISITASTASTSTSTGALIVTGGVGIGASLNVGTSIAVDSGVLGLSLQRAVGASLGAIYSTGVTPSSSNYSFATDGTNLNLNSTNNVNLNISNTSKLTVSTNNVNVGINVVSTSTNTGAFTVTGGVGIGGSLYVGSASSISGVAFNIGSIGATSTTNSTTSSTGALTVTGGVGIGQSASIGGRLQLFNGANYTAFVSSASGNTVYTLPATSPATGSSVLQSTSAGILSWVPMTATGAASGTTSQNIVINGAGNANVFHPILFTPSSSSSGSAVSSDSTITFNPSTEILNVSGLAITSGTASTNTTTGALLVRGGLGVTGQLSFTRASLGFTGVTGTPSMAFIGATTSSYISLNVLSNNSLSFEGSSGQLFSIDNNLSSGEIFAVSDISGLPIISASAGQTVSLNEFGGYTRIGNGSLNSSTASNTAADGSLVVYGGVGITGNANIGGTVRFTNTTQSTTSSSGAFVVSGGVGIGQSISVGGRLQLFNGSNYSAFVSSATGNTVYTLPATSPATGSSVLQATSAGVMSWTPMIAPGGTTDGIIQYKSGSSFGGTLSLFFDTNTFGLRVSGFPGGNTTSGTDAVLKLEATVGSFNGSTNGTYIAVNAPNGFTGDLMNLQVNASSKFRIDNTGAIIQTIGTNSSSTTTGALQVRGGAGITGNAYIGGILNASSSINFGTNTFSKNSGAGDVALDNGTTDTPAVLFYYKNNTNFGIDTFSAGAGSTRFRIVKDLNETGGSELWSIDRSGIVTQTAWAVGETINTAMYNYSDLGMSATTTISSTSYTTFATITYTPKSSTSYLWIEFSCTYTVAGAAADDFWSNIEVGGVEQVNSNQVWLNGAGGGTRSGVLFPLAARYTNTGTTGLTITVRSKRGTSDDNATIYGNTSSGYMRIQEIGR